MARHSARDSQPGGDRGKGGGGSGESFFFLKIFNMFFLVFEFFFLNMCLVVFWFSRPKRRFFWCFEIISFF